MARDFTRFILLEQAMMRLEYSITRFDLFRATARALLYQRVLWLVGLPFMAIAWWNSFSWRELQNQALAVRIITATLTVAACVAVGGVGGCLFLGVQSLLRRDKGHLGNHTLEITNEGLVESTEVNRSLANWRTPFRIRETRRYAYIHISDTNFHLIPKRRLSGKGSLNEFLTELRARSNRFQQGASNGGPAEPLGSSGVGGGPPSVS